MRTPSDKNDEDSFQNWTSNPSSEVDLQNKLHNSQDYFFNSTSKVSNDKYMTKDHQITESGNNDLHSLISKEKKEFNVTNSMESDFKITSLKNKINVRMPSNKIHDIISKPSISKITINSESIHLSKYPIIFKSTSNGANKTKKSKPKIMTKEVKE